MRENIIKILLLTFVTFVTSGYCVSKHLDNQLDDFYTQQPYKVELIDNTTTQTQNQMTLKVANDYDLKNLKVGDKILFTLPSDVNLEEGRKIKAGTKFSATIVMKQQKKNPFSLSIKFIINEIIFDDTTNFIILSNPKGIQPLKSISAERILGKGREVTGTFRLETVISEVKLHQHSVKLKPDTTTAVGICILAKTNKISAKLNSGTPLTITFLNNIRPEVDYIKYTVKKSY